MSDGRHTRPPSGPYRPAVAPTLIQRAMDLIDTARPMPLSTSVIINKDEVLEVLQEALDRMPEELRAARWLLKEREEYLAKVRREGDEILDLARSRAERMVERTEVVKAAEARARRIVEEAEDAARHLRHEVDDYCEQKLAHFESLLDRTRAQVVEGRARFAGRQKAAQEPQASAVEAPDEEAAGGVFDQDVE